MENENDPDFPSGRPRQRRKKLSEVQKHRMLKFMEEHPRLSTGGYDYSFTVDVGRRLWQELADILNALDGPKKSWEIWRRCYRDIVIMQKKAGKLGNHSRSQAFLNIDSSSKNDASSEESVSDGDRSIENPLDTDDTFCDRKKTGKTSVRKISQNPLRSSRIPQPSSSAGTSRDTSTTVEPKKLDVQNGTETEVVLVPDNPDSVQQDYYRKKLFLMERQTLAFEAMAESMQMQAEAFYDLSDSVTTLNSIMKDLNIQ